MQPPRNSLSGVTRTDRGRTTRSASNVAKGQTVSLFAVEQEPWFDDNAPKPPYYRPTVADTLVGNAATEFSSWSGPCSSAAFGDCQLLNVQNATQVTANFQRLQSVNVEVVGVGNLIRTITTRPLLNVAPVLTTNAINGTTDTVAFSDSASAYAYEVALFSGSQLTLTAIEPPNFTVHFDGWSGGCNAAGGATCTIKWPATAGSAFTYPYSGTQPIPAPQARFQYYYCTQNGQFSSVNGNDVSNPAANVSCSLRSP